ncbi:hypothetical protein ACHAXR_010005 [Thalassiosira sp. AJA248-18]
MPKPTSSSQEKRKRTMARRALKYPTSPAGGGSTSDASSSPQHPPPTPESQDSITTEAILAKLAKAKEIESTLESIAAEQKGVKKRSPSSDEKTQKLRLQLCEVLSDVILNDSTLADTNDAIGRLWKNCFYGRINDVRTRIMKEKSRAKKRTAPPAIAADGSKIVVADLERKLKEFLDEAIQLYRYIIERYVKELMPLSQSQASGMSEQLEEEERSLIIISSLYRMHIHLGDLYRYSTSYKLAEECYSKSAKLAPGTGNPFNQLAVVAQLQSQDSSLTAVSLYYYARSLMATRAPFETSRGNLVRLFESNQKWMEEHLREDGDDDVHSRGIVNVDNMDVAAVATKATVANKKVQKEWMQKERAAMNRKAMARLVDLQWALFRGVSLDDDDDANNKGQIDLDKLMKKMTSLLGTYTNLISHASFSESLLCKLVATIAFSALGASNNGGKLVNVDRFDAKRAKDPKWNEGILMTNQALAFSFVLRFCAILAKDIDAVIAKREAADMANKVGMVRSLSPLLLGLRFVTSVYEGCEWFHGLPFFPGIDGVAAAGSEMEGNSIYKLCKDSHVEFWMSIASLANHLDNLSKKKKSNNAQEEDMADLLDKKDFAEFQGYVPFAPFLDKYPADTTTSSLQGGHKEKTKYATPDEVIDALSETKHSRSGKGIEAETNMKIQLFLSIVDKKTCRPASNNVVDNESQVFLTKNPDTNKREFFIGSISTDDETEVSEQKMDMSHEVSSLNITHVDGDNATEEMDQDDGIDVPLQMPALLTPAALLAGISGSGAEQGRPPMNGATVNHGEESKKKPSSPMGLPVDSMLVPSSMTAEPLSNIINTAVAHSAVDTLLQPTTLPSKQQEPQKAPLLPPPGFSMQPAEPAATVPQQLPIAPSTTGISLAEFTVTRQAEQNIAFGSNQATSAVGEMMPQAAGPSYPATSSMFETMNPFFQVPPQSFNNDFISDNSSASLNQQYPGLLNPVQDGVNLQQTDPTLNFLFSNNRMESTNKPASTNALNILATSAAEPEDPSESILNFLFNDTSQAGHQPLYAANRQQHSSQQHGVPPNKNPFAM